MDFPENARYAKRGRTIPKSKNTGMTQNTGSMVNLAVKNQNMFSNQHGLKLPPRHSNGLEHGKFPPPGNDSRKDGV